VTLVVAALLAAVEVGGGTDVAPPPQATSRSTASKLSRANKVLFRLMKERVSIRTPFGEYARFRASLLHFSGRAVEHMQPAGYQACCKPGYHFLLLTTFRG
jgi:hypothetical protein